MLDREQVNMSAATNYPPVNNLPGSSTRDTKTVKNVKSYVKKVDEEENDIAKGAVIPEKYKNALWVFSAMYKVPNQRQTDHGVWSNKSKSSGEYVLSREFRR